MSNFSKNIRRQFFYNLRVELERLMFNEGCVLDCAEMMDDVLKKGSWYSYGDQSLEPAHLVLSTSVLILMQSESKSPSEPRLDSLRSMENKDLKITLALGNSLFADQKKNPNIKIENSFRHAFLALCISSFAACFCCILHMQYCRRSLPLK